jgi:predicted nuclease of predicted toxin-antitoxin system
MTSNRELMRFLVDMNLTPRWAGFLVEAGHEAVHWSVVGHAEAKDREICDHARRHGYAILTNDLDFPQILAHTRDTGPSVVLLRGEPLVPETRGSALLRAIESCQEEIGRGAIVTLDWSDKPRAKSAAVTMTGPPSKRPAAGVRPEYDFSGGIRAKYVDRYRRGTNVVLLDPELVEAFPDSKSVNDALRALLAIATPAKPRKRE